MDQNENPLDRHYHPLGQRPKEKPLWLLVLMAVPVLLWFFVIGPFLRGFLQGELYRMFGMTPPSDHHK